MEKDFESIRSKVQKLQALAERGEKGEALNAKRLLDQLLAKYGVSLEEIVRSTGRKTAVHLQRKGKRVRIYFVYPVLFQRYKRNTDELPPAQKIRYR